jgi:hypothetical protein
MIEFILIFIIVSLFYMNANLYKDLAHERKMTDSYKKLMNQYKELTIKNETRMKELMVHSLGSTLDNILNVSRFNQRIEYGIILKEDKFFITLSNKEDDNFQYSETLELTINEEEFKEKFVNFCNKVFENFNQNG